MMQCIQELEIQVKEGHESLESAINKIATLEEIATGSEKKLEEVRKRVTKIAELFEKKSIS